MEGAAMTVSIGVDIDDCIYPWYDRAHEWCISDGLITSDTPRPSSWAPYEEYKIEAERWYESLGRAAQQGSHLYLGPPMPGAVEALRKAVNHDIEVVLITARGSFAHGHRIIELTKIWADLYVGDLYADLHFTRKKGPLAKLLDIDYAIDDSGNNVTSYEGVGIPCALKSATWNKDLEANWPVDHIEEFVDGVIAREELA